MRSIRKITFKPRWQTNLSVVLVSEWWVNTPITELGDIARHSARWRGINWNFKIFFFFFFLGCTVYKPHPRLWNFFGGKKVRFIHRYIRYMYIPLALSGKCRVICNCQSMLELWQEFKPHTMWSIVCWFIH